MRLTELSEDPFLEILQNLTVFEIVRLRPICRRFCDITQTRELWSRLAKEEVLDKKLPWPSYAWPLASIPAETIEALTIRAILLRAYWDEKMQFPKTNYPARCMYQYRGARVTFIQFLRSRWIVSGTRSGLIQLWDLQDPFLNRPTASCDLSEGRPTTAVVEDDAIRPLKLFLSTSSAHTFVFELGLPFLGSRASRATAIKFHQVQTITGRGYILDAKEQLMAFGQSPDGSEPVILDGELNAVHLVCDQENAKLQSTLAIKILSPVIAVAKQWEVQIYSVSLVTAALDSTGSFGMAAVTPHQTIPYPCNAMVSDVSFLLLPPDPSSNLSLAGRHGRGITLGVFHVEAFWVWSLMPGRASADTCPQYTWDEDSACDPRTVRTAQSLVQMCWGPSGTRLAYLGCRQYMATPSLYGVRVPPVYAGSDFKAKKDSYDWALPNTDDARAFGWTCAFDECTGLIAAAMSNGWIWVIDPLMIWKYSQEAPTLEETTETEQLTAATADSDADTLPSFCDTFRIVDVALPEDHLPEDEDVAFPMHTWLPDLCAPAPSWSSWPPLDVYNFGSTAPLLSWLQSQVPKLEAEDLPAGWSNDWRDYKYLKGWSNHYGGFQWYFREVLHLSGRAVPVIFGDHAQPPTPDIEGGPFYAPYPHADDADSNHPFRGTPRSEVSAAEHECVAEQRYGDTVLVQVGSQYFLHEFRIEGTNTMLPRGSPDLGDVLARLRGELEMDISDPVPMDSNAISTLMCWCACARTTREFSMDRTQP